MAAAADAAASSGARRFVTEEEYRLAATLAWDAQRGAGSVHSDDAALVRSYRLYHWRPLRLLLQCCVGAVLLLALFEQPNGSLGLLLPLGAALALELACLAVFAARLLHLRRISVPRVFWHDKKNIALLTVLLVRGGGGGGGGREGDWG